jgi:hypothetical protein
MHLVIRRRRASDFDGHLVVTSVLELLAGLGFVYGLGPGIQGPASNVSGLGSKVCSWSRA